MNKPEEYDDRLFDLCSDLLSGRMADKMHLGGSTKVTDVDRKWVLQEAMKKMADDMWDVELGGG
tara:strand:- start:5787 stop:5978 length:192 start_codon:yes stop_codon:yes gene_type:complete